MSHDDDTLAHIDLSAWDAPPPPANFADAVIERMGSADAGISVPVEGPPGPRRTWLVGAALVAAAMVAIVAWSLLRSPEQPAQATGAVVAERARSLSLPGVEAELDAGADVRWRRDGDVLHVEQRAGTVAWRVAAKRKLVIDAGAALASVEATGANLRVEVQMNAMDARVIGASALTAAAVAMVTVVVYEGHVSVNRPGQQTVVVAPGSTYQVRPEQEAPVVGRSRPAVRALNRGRGHRSPSPGRTSSCHPAVPHRAPPNPPPRYRTAAGGVLMAGPSPRRVSAGSTRGSWGNRAPTRSR
jgi:ferric-dicitrate binding protein FerR (iron transport regulator)